MSILVLIDNGHGENTLGKCSPDHRIREWSYTRDIAQRVSRVLSLRGVDTMLLVPESTDTPLRERVRRVNGWCLRRGSQRVVLVSIHLNAAGADGKWHDARGFSVFVSQNASSSSRRLASMFTERAASMGLGGNRCVPKEKYWVQSLAMTRDSNCPAVLTENLFQDNEEDVEFLLSDAGREAVAQLHVDSILEYIRWKEGEVV